MALNKTFDCADVKIGDTALFYTAQRKRGAPRWRGPALILDIGETGVTVKSQSRTFKVARPFLRKKVEAKDAEDAEPDPLRERSRPVGFGAPVEASGCGDGYGCG